LITCKHEFTALNFQGEFLSLSEEKFDSKRKQKKIKGGGVQELAFGVEASGRLLPLHARPRSAATGGCLQSPGQRPTLPGGPPFFLLPPFLPSFLLLPPHSSYLPPPYFSYLSHF
jgi:hypothetical protein